MMRVHGTCVAIDGKALLLRGASGSGKSDLALRLIDNGASLVSDDQVEIMPKSGTLIASAPAALAGRIEVRGVGILPVSSVENAVLALVIDLVARDQIVRLPERRSCTILGIELPLIALSPFDAAAAAKTRFALQVLTSAQAVLRKA